MRRAILTLGLLAIFGSAQTNPTPRTISGVTVDSSGKPILQAWIDHTGKFRMTYFTDEKGRFEISTTAPAVVIRKAGFQSVRIPAENASNLSIVLEPARSSVACKLRKMPEIARSESRDSDYTATHSVLKTKEGSKTVTCGQGPNWSLGIPSDSNVRQSELYSEQMVDRDDEGFGLVDARGRNKDGSYWRYRGQFGSSCAYVGVDITTALILDCVIEKARP